MAFLCAFFPKSPRKMKFSKVPVEVQRDKMGRHSD